MLLILQKEIAYKSSVFFKYKYGEIRIYYFMDFSTLK